LAVAHQEVDLPFRYWSEFRHKAVERMLACEWVKDLAAELGVAVPTSIALRPCLHPPRHTPRTDRRRDGQAGRRLGTQHARNICMELADGGTGAIKFLIRDQVFKFTASFDAVFAAQGIRIIKTPIRTPRANAICERVIGTLRRVPRPLGCGWKILRD
jgi:hypothetical protein